MTGDTGPGSRRPESPQRVAAARPGQRFTPDGRHLREVLSYSRRGYRFTPTQSAAWAAHSATWVIPESAIAGDDFVLGRWFGREGPLMVEIGSGVGEATVVLAASRPEVDVLAFEVWRPGIATTLAAAAEAGVTNLRLCAVDAAWALQHRIARSSVSELWTFFPDPWPKTKHHKRRLVTAEFAAMAADRLTPGGLWRLATDWSDYAAQMVGVLDATPGLSGGATSRWAERPVTKFERKAIAAGRPIVDLTYRRGS